MIRRLLLAAPLVLATPFLVLPVLLGGTQPATCGTTAMHGLDSEQLANAAIITETATRMSLGRQAAVIGVMTALTESSLRNVSYGDEAGPDSRGLFQQRDQWGPLEVRMNPVGTSKLFFQALIGVPHWQTTQPWLVAQQIQRSAFADGRNYASSYALASRIVDRGDCRSSIWTHSDAAALPGAAQAVARARALVGSRGYYQLCARLAANIWGLPRAGYASAADQWEAMVASGNAHFKDRKPPVGALVFWDTGGPNGHVAVYVGSGQIVSNDIRDSVPGEGGVYQVDVAVIESDWGATYLGWAPPIYAAQA